MKGIRIRRAGVLALALAGCALGAPAVASADAVDRGGILEIDRDEKLPVVVGNVKAQPAIQSARRSSAATAAATPPLGTSKIFVGRDDVAGQYVLKFYTLRGVGEKIEVWVANNLNFPAGDCRNDGVRNVVTDAQVQYLVGQFDTNMYPKMSAAFSSPPDRDGTGATLPSLVPPSLGITPDYYMGDGDNIVALVDNVRDDNYFDTNNANGFSYIAGFFSTQLNAFFGRNVMTVDSWDWLHRTGANPPDEPVAGNNCTSAPARPFRYEGIFAHEYQHLLVSYKGGEATFMNEGLADYAQTVTGYVDPARPITDSRFDSHVQCFLGWLGVQSPANPNPSAHAGPENSLTVWGDQGGGEILCDYGAAYTFVEYLVGLYGPSFAKTLHNDPTTGLAGVQKALDERLSGKTAQDHVDGWAAMVALDGTYDRQFKNGVPWPFRWWTTPSLNALIRWDTPDAYDTPGAPPNGSDYVRLRNAAGQYIRARDLRTIDFSGQTAHPSSPLEWTSVTNAAGREGNAVYFSGAADDLDRMMVKRVTVPAAPATLTFEHRYDIEETWDFGFVQVSTDGGETYGSLSNANTSSVVDPNALASIKANLPGFSGHSGGWRTETFDLSPYAGQTILLAFRYMTDGEVVEPAWYVDDVKVNGALIGDGASLEGWMSLTQARPVPIGWTLQLVGYRGDKGLGVVAEVPVRDGAASIGLGHVARLIPGGVDTIAAIVTYDDPKEESSTYARYTLKINGVTQPGG